MNFRGISYWNYLKHDIYNGKFSENPQKYRTVDMKTYTYIHVVATYRSSQITYKKCDTSLFARRYRRAKGGEETHDYLLII
jgi:hypothetical protein